MNIAVYCASTFGNSKAYDEGAAALGTWIAEHGNTLVYGGCKAGLMGTVADAALEKGGKVVGVLANTPRIHALKHPGLTELIEMETFAERKTKMIELADAHIALPGGPGTLDEITDVMNLLRAGTSDSYAVFYDINGFYQPMREQILNMLYAGFIQESHVEHVLISDDLEEISEFLGL